MLRRHKKYYGLLPSQPSKPLLNILNLRNTWISIYPKGEESLVMLYGFTAQAILTLINISQLGIIIRKP